MTTKLENIEVGVGIGPVRFGMTREEILDILGEADEVENFEEIDPDLSSSEIWHYDELEVSLSFDEAARWTLVAISTSSPDITLAGKKLMGLGQEEVSKFIAEFDLGEIEEEELEEEDGVKSTLFSLYESAMNFWFEDNELTEIQWGAFWDEETLN